jgi:hypothetical protein
LRVLGYCSGVLGLTDVRIQWVLPISEIDVILDDIQYISGELRFGVAGGEHPKRGYHVSKLGEFWGAVFPLKGEKTIYIRADLSLRRVCGAIAHECKHLAEFGPGRPGRIPISPEDDAASEARAEEFASETLRSLNILDLEKT